MKTWVLSLFSLILLASCQVKQASSPSGLISGHAPAQNAFQLGIPSNANYTVGETLSFTLTHPFAITVSGTPRLVLTVGASTVYADYVSGSGSKSLVFSYTILAGQNDPDGISVASSIDLNGGSLTFNDGNNALLLLTLPSTSGIRIDTKAPAITAAAAPVTAPYYLGSPVVFRVTFDEPVVVTGAPAIEFTVDECTSPGAQTKKAVYAGGNRTTTLSFSYAPEATCNETTEISFLTAIQLNGGTIKDEAGNLAALSLSPYISSPLSSTIQIRGRYPRVSGVVPPVSGTYRPGENIELKVLFDRNVTVTGSTSYVSFTLGSDSTKRLEYVSGSGTSELLYRYTVYGGDVDADGIELSSQIVNEGSICAGAFCLVNNQSDVFPVPPTTGVIVEAPIPTITAIQLPSPLPASGFYKLGEMVQVIVRFSEPVTVVGGTPELSAIVGSTPRTFTYLSGSGTANLLFTYTVQDTDLDSDGVSFTSPLGRLGATIQNAYGTNANLAFTFAINPAFSFDGILPRILSSAVASSVGVNHPDYRLNDYLYIDLTFSEAVTLSGSTLAITVGGAARTATYASSVSPTVKRFRYRVQTTDHTANRAASLSVATTLSGGTVQDQALNDIVDRSVPVTNTTGVELDGAVPSVSSFVVPAGGNHKNGTLLSFTLNFSEPVVVSGIPSWGITLGAGGPASATYSSGSGSSALVFTYTVDGNDLDTDGITMANSLTLSGATISDASVGNPITNSFLPPDTSAVRVDGIIPTVVGVSGPSAATYVAGQSLDFSVTYSEAVSSTGTPQLVLNIGGVTKYANYVSGSGSNSFVYRYTVEAELTDRDGVQVTGHILNAGTIRDAASNNTDLSIATQNFSTVLVDSRGPLLQSITPPVAGTRVSGQTLSFSVGFDEAVIVAGGTPSITLSIGGSTVNANYASGSGSSTLIFTTPALTADHFAPDGISYSASSIVLNGATLRDALNHSAQLGFTAGSLAGIRVIYSAVLSWLQASQAPGGNGATITSLTDISPKGNSASTGTGSVTKIASDSGLNNKVSANFNGSSGLTLPALSAKTIVVAFRTSSTPSNVPFVFDALTLKDSTDLDWSGFTRARVAQNGGSFGAYNYFSCSNCYNSSSTKILMVEFESNKSIMTNLGEGFNGRFAEVWILDGSQSLTETQLRRISSYLAGKY